MKFTRKIWRKLGTLCLILGLFFVMSMIGNAAEDDIAGGVIDEEYGHITWRIENRCLYVEGTGDFSDKEWTYDKRAPWEEYHDYITSAKVKVTGMTDASRMFYHCYNLEKADFTGSDTSNVTNMAYMFSGCSKLEILDLRGFDTSNVTNMSGMFSGCTELQNLAIDEWATSNVVDMSNMFRRCRRINLDDLSNLDTGNVKNMSGMFAECCFVSFHLEKFNTQNVTTMKSMFENCEYLKYISLNQNDISNLKNMCKMFYGCDELENANLIGMNGEKVKDISYMFAGCTSLKAIDFRSFKNSPLTNVEGVFCECTALKTIELAGLDTSRVTSLNSMFSGCKSLEALDISIFDTGNVETMNNTFAECELLKALDVSGFDTSKVTSFKSTFAYCKSVETLDVSGFSTENAMNMSEMFLGCNSVKKLDVKGFDTSKVGAMDRMFAGCSSVKTLDISNFDTSNVQTMEGMFASCSSLETLDITSFDMKKVANIAYMFDFCTKLKYLDLSDWELNYVEGYNSLVLNCFEMKKLAVPVDLLREILLPRHIDYNEWTWHMPDGRKIQYLPTKLTKSIVITRNIPVEEYFKDVYANQWYTDYVQYSFNNDLMSGNEYQFEPDKSMTRGMVVQTLYNMEGKPKVTDYKACTELKDVYQDWYTDAVCWAYNKGITTGYDDSKTFKVNESVTREQLATFLYRYAEFKGYEREQIGDLSELKNSWKVSAYAVDAVKWAVGAGMVSGMDIVTNGVVIGKDLAPQGTATRAQMSAILQRFSEAYIPLEIFEWNGHSYALFNNCKTWEEAKVFCESKGGYLAVISSAEENEALYTFLKENGYGNAFFGLSDVTEEGNWTWVNGEETDYTNWNASEPSNGVKENYAMFFWVYEDGTWNDGTFCKNVYDGGNIFVCEWE